MQGNPIRVKGIDIEVQIVFRPEHIEIILPHYEKIGMPVAVMDEMIDAYIASGEKVDYGRWFLEYGQSKINALINQKLGRAIDHPTFNNLLKFALKDIIEVDPIIVVMRKAKQLIASDKK